MTTCQPLYFLMYEENCLIARACLWRVPNEPLPPSLPAPLRKILSTILHRWPPFICRSPMANTSGLILPSDQRREAILALLTNAALSEAKRRGASVLLFDFLKELEAHNWPSGFVTSQLPSSGTIMENRWQSLEDYLAHGNKKDRQHYKRSLREAEKRGIRLTWHTNVSNMQAAVALIRGVERRYASPPNPWIESLLENMPTLGGVWLEAHIEARLVGCGLILEDNGAQMTTALGLAENEDFVYFRLVYASLEAAFEKKVRLLRWGSGAYEVKQRLGFELEHDNYLTLCGTNRLTNLMGRLAA